MTKCWIPPNLVSSSLTQEWLYQPYLCPEVRGESNKVEISENWKIIWARPCRGGCRVAWYLKQMTLSYIIYLKVVFQLCWWVCTNISSIFSLSVHPWNTPLWMTLVPWHVPFAVATSVTSAYQHTRLVALEFFSGPLSSAQEARADCWGGRTPKCILDPGSQGSQWD